jgi:hypothetical protein
MGFNGDMNSDFHGIYIDGDNVLICQTCDLHCASNVRYFDCPNGDICGSFKHGPWKAWAGHC